MIDGQIVWHFEWFMTLTVTFHSTKSTSRRQIFFYAILCNFFDFSLVLAIFSVTPKRQKKSKAIKCMPLKIIDWLNSNLKSHISILCLFFMLLCTFQLEQHFFLYFSKEKKIKIKICTYMFGSRCIYAQSCNFLRHVYAFMLK